MRNWHAVLFAGLIIVAGAIFGIAQQSTPGGVNGGVYLASPPALQDRQSNVNLFDSTGKLRMAGLACGGYVGPGDVAPNAKIGAAIRAWTGALCGNRFANI